MIRKAIFFSRPSDARAQKQSIGEYLQSNLGGAWKKDEIIEAALESRPSVLSTIADAEGTDLLQIYVFAPWEKRKGPNPWSEAFVTTGEHEISEREFNPAAKRCLFFIESVLPGIIPSFPSQEHASRSESPIGARMHYDKAYGLAEQGFVRIYSPVQTSERPRPSLLEALIDAAQKWSTHSSGALDVRTALQGALLAIGHPLRHLPEVLSSGRRLQEFPFAVAP